MRAGFAEREITPPLGTPLAGMGTWPEAKAVDWPLMARVAVFEDGASRAAIASLDLLALLPSTALELRRSVADAVAATPEAVLVSCSHTHYGPNTMFLWDRDPDRGFLTRLSELLRDAAAEAAARLEPVTLRGGTASAHGLTFSRRPLYRGGQVGTQGPHFGEDYLGPEGDVDETLAIVAAEGPDGTVAGGIVNFSCHPTTSGLIENLSADFPGALTAELSRRHGAVFLFLQGTSGDLWGFDFSSPPPDGPRPPARERVAKIGSGLADAAERILDEAVPFERAGVAAATTSIDVPVRQPTLEQVELARWYLEDPEAKSTPPQEFARRVYGHDFTFFNNSPEIETWFAREAIGMWEWRRHAAVEQLVERVEVQAIRIGDAGFVGYPAEMFAEFGLATRASSRLAPTFVCGLANGCLGYVPTQVAFEHGGYEPRLGNHSRLAENAGDRMTTTGIELLGGLA